jgi:hypothetical protein
MDEITFQHQLRELKQRVSNMAEASSSVMPPRPHTHPGLAPGLTLKYHQDLYTAQLHDLKQKLDRMQANPPKQWQDPAVQAEFPFNVVPKAVDCVRQDIHRLNETIARNNALEKESYATLRHEMSNGFAKLEQAISELGRNTAFTPASSEATDEDLTAAQAGFPADTTAVPSYGHGAFETASQPRCPPEPWSAFKPPHEVSGPAREQNRNSDDSRISQFPGLQQGLGQGIGPPTSVEDGYRTLNCVCPCGTRHDLASDLAGIVGSKEKVALPQANNHGFPFFATDQKLEGVGNAFPQIRPGPALPSGRQAGFEGVTQLIQETCPRPAVLSEPLMAVCPPQFSQDTKRDIGNFRDSLLSRGDTGTTGETSRAHSGITEDESQPEDVWGASYRISPEQARLNDEQITNQQLRDTIAAKDEEIAELVVSQVADRREKDAIITHLNDCKSAAEEAFAITRSNLERRLDEAKVRHDEVSYYYGESQAEIHRLERLAELAQLDFEMSERARRQFEGPTYREIQQLRRELEQYKASRHHFMTKYVDENYRFKRLEQSNSQSEQRLQLQLDECRDALENSERNRDADIRSALQSRDEDLDRLQVFCKEKGDVVYRQEQIIAQGASILEERDAEIDRLSAALDESKRSEQDAREHAAKNKRTIQKRDAQVERLHSDVKEERERRCRLEDLMRRDAEAMRTKAKDVRFSADEQDSRTSFANAANVPAYAVSRGRSGRQNPLWTNHIFGSSSPIVQHRRKSGGGGKAPRVHDVHKRPVSPNNVTEEDSRGQHQHSAMHPDPSRHQSERLGSNREALQLLAGWTETLPRQQQQNSRPREHQASQNDQQQFDYEHLPAHLKQLRQQMQWEQQARRRQRQQHQQTQAQHSNPVQPPAHLQQLQQQRQEAMLQQQRQHQQTQARQTQADMSHQRPGAGSGGGRRSPSSRMEAQTPTNGESAENGRHALPLDTTWLPAPAQAAAVERVGSVPDLRAGSRSTSTSRDHDSRGHSATSKPASMFDLRPQKGHMQSQTYRAPSVETEAESDSAEERAA